MKVDLYIFYKFWNSFPLLLLRSVILIGGAIVLFAVRGEVSTFKIFLVLYSYFLVHEAFIHFKIDHALPIFTINDNTQNIHRMMILKTRAQFSSSRDGLGVVKKLTHAPDVSFMISKIGGFNMYNFTIEKEELLKKAHDIALQRNGVYITSADLFAAYLLLTELQSHLLQEKDLTEKDVVEIVMWVRQEFPVEKPKRHAFHFTGFGVFDFFIYGWDTYIREFAFDVTYAVVGKRATPIVGREKEFIQMTEVLSKGSVNNVLLVGDAGVGRTSLVYRLAQESYQDPRFILGHRKVYEVMVDRLLAGASVAGDLETRLGLLFAEVSHSGNIILFIQNIENIFGGGGFGFDMSGILYEYLKNGSIQIIGSTTPEAYKQIIEKKQSIVHLFEEVKLEEPDRESVFQMIAAHVPSIEHDYGVTISYKAIHDATELSSTYMPGQALPGKALNLLVDVATRVRHEGRNIVEKGDVVALVQEKTNIILEKPTDDEKQVLLHLEDEMHKKVIGQDAAITAIAKAIRRLRSGFKQNSRPISVFLFLGPTGVGKTETAKTLADIYFGDESNMIRLDMSEYQTQNEVERLLGGVPGGEELQDSLPEQVRQHPFSLVLLDEFEKAHPRILDIFLQVFEDGRLTDNQGRTVSFKHTIIIATSNAGSETIRELTNSGIDVSAQKNDLVEGLLQSGIFKPELLNRFDDVIVFSPLTVQEAKQIAGLLLKESLKSLEDDQIYLTFDDSVLQKIVRESYDDEAGARNMRRYIGSEVEDFISQLILKDELPKGTHGMISLDSNNSFIIASQQEVLAASSEV